MATNFSGQDSSGPASGSVTITPSDVTVLARPSRGLFVGVAGNVAVRMAADQSTPIFVGVAAGTLLPISVDKVLATGTTATTMVAVF
jgi:hypothetical protein